MIRPLVAGIFCMSASAVDAAEIVDQSQPVIDATRGFLGIGGDSEQKLAQTFRAGVTGDLVALRLPITGCGRGDLVLEIRVAGPAGSPDGTLLNTTRIDPALAPVSGTALHEFRLSAPARIRSSASYAFTLRMDPPTAVCSFAHSPLAPDLYAHGEYFYESLPNPPGWLTSVSTGGQSDLAFETVVDTGTPPPAGSGRNCLIPGGPAGGLPIPESLPVCRCLRDEGLREFRCAFLHPDFFAIRRSPWPIEIGRPYTETWEVLPLSKLRSPISVRLEGANIPKPVDISFKGVSRKSVQTRAVTLSAPEKMIVIKGNAVLLYGQERWTIDRTIDADMYGIGEMAPTPHLK